jgi:peptide/nickel transport system permease protein
MRRAPWLGPLGKRLALSLITLVLASVIIFVATEVLPGDVATSLLGKDATPASVAALRQELDLDRPPLERYGEWVGGAVRGDLGTSLTRNEPITEMIGPRLRNTLLLALVAIAIGVPLSIGLGIVAGLRRDSPWDFGIALATLVGISMPEFVIGTVLVMVFAIWIPLFPAVAVLGENAPLSEILPNVWLPAATLVIIMASYISRMVRTSLIDTMQSEYVEYARLKGVRSRRVVLWHALPSALLPTINVVGLTVAWLVGGVVVVETVFNYPGIGTLTVSAVQHHDLPLVQALGLLSAVAYILINLAADLLMLVVNPRLRHRRP